MRFNMRSKSSTPTSTPSRNGKHAPARSRTSSATSAPTPPLALAAAATGGDADAGTSLAAAAKAATAATAVVAKAAAAAAAAVTVANGTAADGGESSGGGGKPRGATKASLAVAAAKRKLDAAASTPPADDGDALPTLVAAENSLLSQKGINGHTYDKDDTVPATSGSDDAASDPPKQIPTPAEADTSEVKSDTGGSDVSVGEDSIEIVSVVVSSKSLKPPSAASSSSAAKGKRGTSAASSGAARKRKRRASSASRDSAPPPKSEQKSADGKQTSEEDGKPKVSQREQRRLARARRGTSSSVEIPATAKRRRESPARSTDNGTAKAKRAKNSHISNDTAPESGADPANSSGNSSGKPPLAPKRSGGAKKGRNGGNGARGRGRQTPAARSSNGKSPARSRRSRSRSTSAAKNDAGELPPQQPPASRSVTADATVADSGKASTVAAVDKPQKSEKRLLLRDFEKTVSVVKDEPASEEKQRDDDVLKIETLDVSASAVSQSSASTMKNGSSASQLSASTPKKELSVTPSKPSQGAALLETPKVSTKPKAKGKRKARTKSATKDAVKPKPASQQTPKKKLDLELASEEPSTPTPQVPTSSSSGSASPASEPPKKKRKYVRKKPVAVSASTPADIGDGKSKKVADSGDGKTKKVVDSGDGKSKKSVSEKKPPRKRLPPLYDQDGNRVRRKRGRPPKDWIDKNSQSKGDDGASSTTTEEGSSSSVASKADGDDDTSDVFDAAGVEEAPPRSVRSGASSSTSSTAAKSISGDAGKGEHKNLATVASGEDREDAGKDPNNDEDPAEDGAVEEDENGEDEDGVDEDNEDEESSSDDEDGGRSPSPVSSSVADSVRGRPRRKAAQNMMKRIAKGFTESSSEEDEEEALPEDDEVSAAEDDEADANASEEEADGVAESTGDVSSFESDPPPKEAGGSEGGDEGMITKGATVDTKTEAETVSSKPSHKKSKSSSSAAPPKPKPKKAPAARRRLTAKKGRGAQQKKATPARKRVPKKKAKPTPKVKTEKGQHPPPAKSVPQKERENAVEHNADDNVDDDEDSKPVTRSRRPKRPRKPSVYADSDSDRGHDEVAAARADDDADAEPLPDTRSRSRKEQGVADAAGDESDVPTSLSSDESDADGGDSSRFDPFRALGWSIEETEWTDMEPIDTTKPVVFRRSTDKDLFRGCVITLCGKLKPDQVALRRVIQAHGGQTVQGAGDNVTHALASKKEVRRGSKKIERLQKQWKPILLINWLHDSIHTGKLQPEEPFSLYKYPTHATFGELAKLPPNVLRDLKAASAAAAAATNATSSGSRGGGGSGGRSSVPRSPTASRPARGRPTSDDGDYSDDPEDRSSEEDENLHKRIATAGGSRRRSRRRKVRAPRRMNLGDDSDAKRPCDDLSDGDATDRVDGSESEASDADAGDSVSPPKRRRFRRRSARVMSDADADGSVSSDASSSTIGGRQARRRRHTKQRSPSVSDRSEASSDESMGRSRRKSARKSATLSVSPRQEPEATPPSVSSGGRQRRRRAAASRGRAASSALLDHLGAGDDSESETNPTRRSTTGKSMKPPRWSTDDISLLKELMALLPDDEKIYKRNVQTLLGEEKFAGLRHRTVEAVRQKISACRQFGFDRVFKPARKPAHAHHPHHGSYPPLGAAAYTHAAGGHGHALPIAQANTPHSLSAAAAFARARHASGAGSLVGGVPSDVIASIVQASAPPPPEASVVQDPLSLATFTAAAVAAAQNSARHRDSKSNRADHSPASASRSHPPSSSSPGVPPNLDAIKPPPSEEEKNLKSDPSPKKEGVSRAKTKTILPELSSIRPPPARVDLTANVRTTNDFVSPATRFAQLIVEKSPHKRPEKEPAVASSLQTLLLNDQIRASAQQTSSGKIAANRPLRADEYVDRRIQVWGEKDRAWFFARVRDYNSSTKEHNLEYEGQGDAKSRTEWTNLTKYKVRLAEEEPTEPSPPPSRGALSRHKLPAPKPTRARAPGDHGVFLPPSTTSTPAPHATGPAGAGAGASGAQRAQSSSSRRSPFPHRSRDNTPAGAAAHRSASRHGDAARARRSTSSAGFPSMYGSAAAPGGGRMRSGSVKRQRADLSRGVNPAVAGGSRGPTPSRLPLPHHHRSTSRMSDRRSASRVGGGAPAAQRSRTPHDPTRGREVAPSPDTLEGRRSVNLGNEPVVPRRRRSKRVLAREQRVMGRSNSPESADEHLLGGPASNLRYSTYKRPKRAGDLYPDTKRYASFSSMCRLYKRRGLPPCRNPRIPPIDMMMREPRGNGDGSDGRDADYTSDDEEIMSHPLNHRNYDSAEDVNDEEKRPAYNPRSQRLLAMPARMADAMFAARMRFDEDFREKKRREQRRKAAKAQRRRRREKKEREMREQGININEGGGTGGANASASAKRRESDDDSNAELSDPENTFFASGVITTAGDEVVLEDLIEDHFSFMSRPLDRRRTRRPSTRADGAANASNSTPGVGAGAGHSRSSSPTSALKVPSAPTHPALLAAAAASKRPKKSTPSGGGSDEDDSDDSYASKIITDHEFLDLYSSGLVYQYECYCGKGEENQTAQMVFCGKCRKAFHSACVLPHTSLPVAGEHSYKFQCRACGAQRTQSFEMSAKTWKDIGRDAIYQLALLRPSSEDRPAFFSSSEICAYVEENWHRICKPGGKKREEYSVAGAPMSASSVADPAVTGKKRDAAGRVVDRFGRQDWRVVLFDRMQEFPTLFRRTTYGEDKWTLQPPEIQRNPAFAVAPHLWNQRRQPGVPLAPAPPHLLPQPLPTSSAAAHNVGTRPPPTSGVSARSTSSVLPLPPPHLPAHHVPPHHPHAPPAHRVPPPASFAHPSASLPPVHTPTPTLHGGAHGNSSTFAGAHHGGGQGGSGIQPLPAARVHQLPIPYAPGNPPQSGTASHHQVPTQYKPHVPMRVVRNHVSPLPAPPNTFASHHVSTAGDLASSASTHARPIPAQGPSTSTTRPPAPNVTNARPKGGAPTKQMVTVVKQELNQNARKRPGAQLPGGANKAKKSSPTGAPRSSQAGGTAAGGSRPTKRATPMKNPAMVAGQPRISPARANVAAGARQTKAPPRPQVTAPGPGRRKGQNLPAPPPAQRAPPGRGNPASSQPPRTKKVHSRQDAMPKQPPLKRARNAAAVSSMQKKSVGGPAPSSGRSSAPPPPPKRRAAKNFAQKKSSGLPAARGIRSGAAAGGANAQLAHTNSVGGAPMSHMRPQHQQNPPAAPSAPGGLRQPPTSAPMRIPGPATHHKLVAHSPRAAGVSPPSAGGSVGVPPYPQQPQPGLYSPPFAHRTLPPAPAPSMQGTTGGVSPVSQLPPAPAMGVPHQHTMSHIPHTQASVPAHHHTHTRHQYPPPVASPGSGFRPPPHPHRPQAPPGAHVSFSHPPPQQSRVSHGRPPLAAHIPRPPTAK